MKPSTEWNEYRKTAQMTKVFIVETKEGTMRGEPGDYLVEGIEGEQYPVKKEIFEKSYEPV